MPGRLLQLNHRRYAEEVTQERRLYPREANRIARVLKLKSHLSDAELVALCHLSIGGRSSLLALKSALPLPILTLKELARASTDRGAIGHPAGAAGPGN